MDIHSELRDLLAAFRAELGAVKDENGFNDLKGRYLGKQRGALQAYMGRLKAALPEERRVWGAAINETKTAVEEALKAGMATLRDRKRSAGAGAAGWDPTLPGRRMPLGRIHPVTATQRRLEDLFISMGYAVEEGPEVETEENNFALLNFPADHPSRDMQDTFYVEGGRLLRTHTSPVQIRTMCGASPHQDDLARPRLSPRRRRQPQPHVPPGRRTGSGQGHPLRPLEGHAGDRGGPDLRGRNRDPPASEFFPIHRAECRSGCALRVVRRRWL